ncbi:Lipid A core - O-antigen ligase and related enzymes [Shewanella baltica]|nr:Lipid A core - O-antigen ligase and related enzymes [Shewanella baltica]
MQLNNSKFFLVSLLMLLFLPSFLKVALNASSMALGVIFCFSIIFPYYIVFLHRLDIFYVKKLLYISILFSFLYIHFLLSILLGLDFEFKNLTTLFLILFLFLTSIFYSNLFLYVNEQQLLKYIYRLLLFIIFLGILSFLFRLNSLGYSIYSKSIFPYSEPSHYVTTLGFLFVFCFLIAKKSLLPIVILIYLLVFSLFKPSSLGLIYLSFILFFLTVRLRFWYSLVVILIFFVMILFIFSIESTNLNYFISRMTFSSDSTNSTALVFLQGWEDSWNTIINHPFGLGLQNAKLVESGDIGLRIYEITGRFVNKDGAFLASKLIVEFGLLGLSLVIIYIFFFFRSLLTLIKYSKHKTYFDLNFDSCIKVVFSNSIIVTFFVEMFVRGYGYFSPNVFLLLFAMISTFSKSNNFSIGCINYARK